VTLIQRFGSAANLNIHLHCLVLDGVYRRGTDGKPVFVAVPAPTDEALQAVLHLCGMLIRQALGVELTRHC
jgi:Putative transposase